MPYIEAVLDDRWSLLLLQGSLLSIAATWAVIVWLRIKMRRADFEGHQTLFIPQSAEGWAVVLSACMLTVCLWRPSVLEQISASGQKILRAFRIPLTLLTLTGQVFIIGLFLRIVVVFIQVLLEAIA
jgi:hypothetical protein